MKTVNRALHDRCCVTRWMGRVGGSRKYTHLLNCYGQIEREVQAAATALRVMQRLQRTTLDRDEASADGAPTMRVPRIGSSCMPCSRSSNCGSTALDDVPAPAAPPKQRLDTGKLDSRNGCTEIDTAGFDSAADGNPNQLGSQV
jgi:hypothetical protein